MNSPQQSGTRTETYAYTRETVETTVVPLVLTQSDQIAHYFIEDLEDLGHLARIDLADVLQVPPDYPQETRDIVLMLYDDLSHMLRDQLITCIHFLITDTILDVNTGAYPVRYHARYVIHTTGSALHASSSSPVTRRVGKERVAPPEEKWRDARFAILIDWNENAKERRKWVRRPEYCFDWVPEVDRFDATNLVRYREGGLTVDSATVVERYESTSPPN